MKIAAAVSTMLAVACIVTGAAAPLRSQEAAAAPGAPDATLTLKIGDPRLKDRTMAVAPGGIYDAAKGGPVPFERLIAAMGDSRLVYVGESHTSMSMHDIQLRVLECLYARDRHLAVGLEMLPVTVQETLNAWSAGLLTRDEFLRRVRWYVHWSFNIGYYAPILEFAKEHRLPVYALNVPREIITKIRMRGWDALGEDEKALFPGPPDVSHQDHRTLIRAFFSSSGMPPAMTGPGLDKVFDGLYLAQSAWDEAMGHYAVRGARAEGRRLVVLAGSGHMLYKLGLDRRAFEKSGLPGTTIVAVEVPGGRTDVAVSRSIADYVFGLPAEHGTAFPTIGLGFQRVEGLANLVVESKPRDGAAARSDFEKGDVILDVDGRAYDDINELRLYLAGFGWGGEVRFRLLRRGEVKDVVLKLEKPVEGAETLPGAAKR